MSELYLFNDGTTNFAFTPTLFSKTLNAITYSPAIVKRSKLVLTDNLAKAKVIFTFSKTNSYARSLIQNYSERINTIVIYKDEAQYWHGQVLSVKSSITSIEIACVPLENVLKRKTKGQQLSLHCWKRMYDTNCGLLKADFVVTYTGQTIVSRIFTVGTLTEADNFFSNGFAEMNGQSRRIITQIGTTITLAEAFQGIQIGTLSLYPVCNLTETSCNSFGNLLNHGGFARIPTKNPTGKTGLL